MTTNTPQAILPVRTDQLLEKYKSMSNLQIDFLNKAFNINVDLDFMDKVNDIFKDKHTFVPANFEEDDRKTEREKINTKMLKFVKEVNKIKPMSEVINNLPLFVGMCSTLLLYNDNLTTKLTVNV